MIPSYPYTVQVEFRPHVNRKPIVRACASLDAAMAIVDENKGRQDVYRLTVTVILYQSLADPLKAKRHP